MLTATRDFSPVVEYILESTGRPTVCVLCFLLYYITFLSVLHFPCIFAVRGAQLNKRDADTINTSLSIKHVHERQSGHTSSTINNLATHCKSIHRARSCYDRGLVQA